VLLILWAPVVFPPLQNETIPDKALLHNISESVVVDITPFIMDVSKPVVVE
jgi:hypothetical protein